MNKSIRLLVQQESKKRSIDLRGLAIKDKSIRWKKTQVAMEESNN